MRQVPSGKTGYKRGSRATAIPLNGVTLVRDDRNLIQRARTAGLLDRLRIKTGLPVEFYLQAVQPVIEAYAAHVHSLPRLECSNDDQPDCLFMDGLELATFALDFRRGRILPPNAAPEEIGERAHRWTYAVFVAALLHRELTSSVGSRSLGLLPVQTATGALNDHVEGTVSQTQVLPASPLLVFRRMVPTAIQTWLGADNALLGELHAFLLGEETARSGTIGLLIKRAQDEFVRIRGVGAGTSLPKRDDVVILSISESGECKAVPAPSATQPVRSGPECNAANRFMNWITGGIKDGSIRINEARAPVHFVKEGMLLISPRIFRDFARRYGEDGNGTAQSGNVDESRLGKEIQRLVLRAGWHRKTDHGNNIQCYDVIRNGRPVSGLYGVLITKPQRFVSPVPATNPLLVRGVPT